MRKLDFFRLTVPKCASTAAGAGSLKKSYFLTFSKVLRIGPDQAIYMLWKKNLIPANRFTVILTIRAYISEIKFIYGYFIDEIGHWWKNFWIKADEMPLETLLLGHLDNLHTDEALNNRRVMKGIFSWVLTCSLWICYFSPLHTLRPYVRK